MEFVVTSYLREPEHVQERLGQLVLGPCSGMDNHIQHIRRGEWKDAPIVLAKKDDTIVAWAIISPVPRFWINTQEHPNRPEVQLFVDPNYRRQRIGKTLMDVVRSLYRDFSVCPWDNTSVEFFRTIKR